MIRNNRHSRFAAAWQQSCRLSRAISRQRVALLALVVTTLFFTLACERNPELHLHRGAPTDITFPIIELDLEAYWNYEFDYEVTYDWKAEWYYGWDATDISIFGNIGYTEPDVFHLRRYYTYNDPAAQHTQVISNTVHGNSFQGQFNYGFWDLLVWNDVVTIDGVQSLNFDESTTLEYVTAYTNQTMIPSRYQAPRYTRAFYEPEALFSAYEEDIEINRDLEGFEYDPERNLWVKRQQMLLYPVTYIYLPQIILHNNHNKIVNVDGSGNLSGMARTVNLNSGIAGPDAITVNFNVRFKPNCDMKGEAVDIIGGRLMTFGMCNLNPKAMTRTDEAKDELRHYMDVTMLFNNGIDSTFVFDMTDQVRKLYKGGVLTIELDMDTIPVPYRPGGSAFDAVVKDYEDGGTWEFPM